MVLQLTGYFKDGEITPLHLTMSSLPQYPISLQIMVMQAMLKGLHLKTIYGVSKVGHMELRPIRSQSLQIAGHCAIMIAIMEHPSYSAMKACSRSCRLPRKQIIKKAIRLS